LQKKQDKSDFPMLLRVRWLEAHIRQENFFLSNRADNADGYYHRLWGSYERPSSEQINSKSNNF